VFDWYCALRPGSHLASLLGASACFTTRTMDDGELHPWSTWPTLHRGVYNWQHNIRFINQDLGCAREYPPVWETLARQGFRVGVFGSLQSYPVPSRPAYCFYIPDTFARGDETLPERYRCFQAINLRQTKADGAEAQPISVDSGTLRNLAGLPFAGMKLRTAARLAVQVVREKANPLYRTRRSLLQAPVAFDVFMHAFGRFKPDFSTFFTNHVAGAMHRYWKYAFPEDFDTVLRGDDDTFRRETVVAAMDFADEQVGALTQTLAGEQGMLILATSMGQQAIERGRYVGELRLADPGTLMKAIGFVRPWRDLLAMQPDFNFGFESEADAEQFLTIIRRMRSPSGEPLWMRIRRERATVNLGLSDLQEVIASGTFVLDASERSPARPMSLKEAGFKVLARDPGTGYHQPLGSLAVWGPGIRATAARSEIELAQVRELILSQFTEARAN